MDVGAAVAKAIQRRHQRLAVSGAPWLGLLVYIKGRVSKLDQRVELLQARQAGQRPMVEGEEDLDQANPPGASRGMADGSLGTTHGTKTLLVSKTLEGTDQRIGLHGIPQLRARAVGLDITDVFRVDLET